MELLQVHELKCYIAKYRPFDLGSSLQVLGMSILTKLPKFYTIPHHFENACYVDEVDCNVTETLVDGRILCHLITWSSYSCEVVKQKRRYSLPCFNQETVMTWE